MTAHESGARPVGQRICVFGAGGVGGYMAARLSRAGRDVSVVARGAHLERIRSHGLTVRTANEEMNVALPASESLADFPSFDVIIVTAKAPSLGHVARSLAPHLSDQTAVLFATSGIQWFYGDHFSPSGLKIDTARLDPGGALHTLIGTSRSYGVVVRSSNTVPEPGVIFNSGGGTYHLGAVKAEASDGLHGLVDLLDVDGARVLPTSDIRREMWKKLVRNFAVALVCGLTRSSPGHAFSDADVGPVARDVMREAAGVAAAHGFVDILDLDEEAATIARMTAMKPSIVQDLDLGRPMEFDCQVGAVLDFARQAKVAMPTSSVLAPLLVFNARAAGSYT